MLCDRFDGDGVKEQLRVRFDDDLLARLAGISGRECRNLNDLRSTRPSVVHEIEQILVKLAAKMQAIDAFIKLEYTAESELPVVVDIFEPATVLNRILHDKLQSEQLL